MSTAASDTVLGDTSEELARALPQEAQRHLDALRGAIDLRLAALEAALADPSRTNALESLIIDLARVATVEAQAAATKACVDTRLAAETQTAKAAAAASLVLQQERTAATELRRALDVSETKRLKAETDLGAQAAKTRHAAEAEKVRRDAAAADTERVLNDVRAKSKQALNDINRDLAASRKEAERFKQDFEKEHTANIELKKSSSTAEGRLADLKKDHEQIRLLYEQTVGELERARDAVAETQQALDQARAEAHQERAAAQDTRVTAEKASERAASVESDYQQLMTEWDQLKTSHDDTLAQLTAVRESTTDLERQLTDANEALRQTREAYALEQASRADLQRSVEALTAQLAALGPEQDEARKAQEKLVADLEQAEHRTAELERVRATLEQQLQRDREEAHAAAIDAAAQLTAARESTANLERQLTDTNESLSQIREAYSVEQASSADLQRTVEALTAQLAALGPEQDEARRAQEKLHADLRQAQQRAAELEQARAAIEQRLQQDREEARAAAADATARLEQAGTRLREVESEKGKLKVDHKVVLADFEALQERSHAADRQRVELERERGQFEQQTLRLEERVLELELQLETEQNQSAGIRETADQAEQRLASIVGTQVQAMAHHEDLARQLAAASGEIVTLRTELNETSLRLSKAVGERAGAIERLVALEAQFNAASAAAPSAASRLAATNLGLIIEEPGAATIAGDAPVSSAASVRSPGASDGTQANQWMPVRLAERYRFREPLTVPINGDSGLLCDLSTLGCQLVSAAALKPNQKVRVVIPSTVPLTCTGKVMWARLEPSPKGRGFGYRVGVQFAPATQNTLDTLASFIEERKGVEANPA